MNVSGNDMLDLAGKMISSVVSVLIVFHYFHKRYLRTFKNRSVYAVLMGGCVLLNLGTTVLGIPAVNVIFWFAIVFFLGKVCYYDGYLEKGKYYVINIVFILAVSCCEAVSGMVSIGIVKILEIRQSQSFLSFFGMFFGSVGTIFLYFLILKRLFEGKKMRYILWKQYWVYAAVTACILANIGGAVLGVKHGMDRKDYISLIVISAFVVFLDLCFFYFLEELVETKELKFRVELYENQARDKFEEYFKREDECKEMLSVIHDAKKHVKIMEKLKGEGTALEISDYADDLEGLIAPVLKKRFCGNRILDIVLNDKMDACRRQGISFHIAADGIDMEYMKPVDITTVFGNLLDNAMEACAGVEDGNIELNIKPFNGLIYVCLSNTFAGKIKTDGKGRPVSGKGKGHGIGLENVEKVLEKYNGSIKYSVAKNIFTVEVMFNRP